MNSLLLVDDERWVRAALRHTIEKLNKPFKVVHECANGLEALDWLKDNETDLVLSDIRMPVMDGLEATRIIRRLPAGKAVPILAMTANAFAEDRARCHEAGMNDFLAKPFNPDGLYAILLKCLERRSDYANDCRTWNDRIGN